MISRVENFFRKLRKRISRSEWAVRMLGLPCDRSDPSAPGLILLQVDGLSLRQLERAMAKGRMPFFKRLAQQQGFELKPFYSGVPSTTPAVQAELFYGVTSAVPAFEFIDRKTKDRFVMYESEAANRVAEHLETRGEGLLKNGTSYSNIYTGGAGEARYCIQTLDLKSILKEANPLKLLLLILLHIGKFFRLLGLLALEIGLAVVDFFRGIFHRPEFLDELKFIPTRIGVSVGLRELIRFRVKMDVNRGIPIIHADLIAYDEQSHRRGPSSAFAHWSLKGIDGAVKDIYRTARRSDCRDYAVVLFSDHGQESTVSYLGRHGRRVEAAVREVLASEVFSEAPGKTHKETAVDESANARLHRRGLSLIRSGRNPIRPLRLNPETIEGIRVADMGPVAHLYFPRPVAPEERVRLAAAFVEHAHIPLVLFLDGEGRVAGVNGAGLHDLRKTPEEILGADHPFLEPAAEDLDRLCRHPDAGDFVFSGWDPHAERPMSFPREHGSHGGPGTEETRGFVLLPPRLRSPAAYLRPLDLRRLALDFLRNRRPARRNGADVSVEPFTLRALTYNIHSCINMNGKVSPEKIAQVIEGIDPHVAALQEVDAGRKRTLHRDQARWLAERLEMYHVFHPLVDEGDGQYGLAVLSRFPLSVVERGGLPRPPGGRNLERRGVIWARIASPAGPVHLFNTHLGLNNKERVDQVKALTGPSWLGAVPPEEPVILCGDFNAGPRSTVYRDLTVHLADVQTARGGDAPRPTFFSRMPIFRIDHMLVSRHFTAVRAEVPRNHEIQTASDHLPLWAELSLNGLAEPSTGGKRSGRVQEAGGGQK